MGTIEAVFRQHFAAIIAGLAAFAYGLWERTSVGAEIGLPDVVASVVSSRPYITFILLPLTLLMVAASARTELRAEVKVRRGSHSGTFVAMAIISGQQSIAMVGASVFGSWVSSIGLAPLVFSAAGTASIDNGVPWGLSLVSQSIGLFLFTFTSAMVMAAWSTSEIGSPRFLTVLGGVVVWVLTAGSLNALWGETLSVPLSCAAIALSCGTWAAGLAWSISVAALVLGAILTICGGLDRRQAARPLSVNARVLTAVAGLVVIAVGTALALANEAGSVATVESIVSLTLSADARSPLTLLLALAAFAVVLLLFSLRLDSASIGFGELELVRAGARSVHAGRMLLAAIRIAFVVRLAVFVVSWVSVAITGRIVEPEPLGFLLGAVWFIVGGALWWGTLGLGAGLLIARFGRSTMIIPVVSGVIVSLYIVRLTITGATWPSVDAFVDPLSATLGAVIEALCVVTAASGVLVAAHLSRTRARRFRANAINYKEAAA